MRSTRWCLLSIVLITLGETHTSAININLNFNANDNQAQAFDPQNLGLHDLFSYAEGYYEDVFEDGGYTLTINYWYADLSDSLLGLLTGAVKSGDRIIEADIRIDTLNEGLPRDWFIDPTPGSDEEFVMQKTVWTDLTVNEKADFTTSGQVPDGIEVGYTGDAIQNGPAYGASDMLSVILHEIGHALNIASVASHENADGDYDIDPSFIFGADIAAKIATDGNNQPDAGHVASDTMLMCTGCLGNAARRLPTHADLFAMATSGGLSQLDVPRREFYGGITFDTDANWSGARSPDVDDDAYIRSAGLLTINSPEVMRSLHIIEDTELAIGSNTLHLSDRLVLDASSVFSPADLIVGPFGQVLTQDIEIYNGGRLRLAGGTINATGDVLLGDNGGGSGYGAIRGHGTVNITGRLSNGGDLHAVGGPLVINAGELDLDAGVIFNSPADIIADTGSVTINGTHINEYHGNVAIHLAQTVTFNDPWTLGTQGDVDIGDGGLIVNAPWLVHGVIQIEHPTPGGIVGIGGTGDITLSPLGRLRTRDTADILNNALIQGEVRVFTGLARFSGGAVFADTANIIFDPGTAMDLVLDKNYILQDGASFTGDGTLRVGDLATVFLDDGLTIGVPFQNRGRMLIGGPPGAIDLPAGYEQTGTGTTLFKIGGLVPGTLFDLINITGDALLAGTLQLSLINGFDPVVGQYFQIINADNIVGTFDIVLGADLGSGKAFEVIYNPNNVTLLVTGPLKGDLNGDGFVGIDDLNIVLGNWNQSVPPGDPLADPSGDDFVGIEDLNAVLGNWNAGTPPSYNVNIPEPTTGILLIYAIIPLAARTGRYK